jgi:sporulation protein YlmC with PRC-barrel domain
MIAESLRYLSPERMKIAGRRAEGMEVLTREGRFLGRLEGCVVDSAEGRVCFFVVRPKASSPAVSLALATGARVDPVDGAIRLASETPELEPVGALPGLPFPSYSDEGPDASSPASHSRHAA